MIAFDIYFSDLDKDAQTRLLKEVGISDPKEENWDLFPITTFIRDNDSKREFMSSKEYMKEVLNA